MPIGVKDLDGGRNTSRRAFFAKIWDVICG